MSDLNARDAKLVQYLNEAYGKEKQLETALQAHIGLTTRQPYKKRLQQHLSETKNHGRMVGRRIKELGGSAETVPGPGPDAIKGAAEAGLTAAQRAVALAKGPLHAMRGTSEPEKMLKNAKTEYSEEAEEIATYTSIESLANSVGDKETARIAREIRREEERMRQYLEKLIPQLTDQVVKTEIPRELRNGAVRSGRRTTRRRSTARRSTSSRSRSSTASRSRARSGSSTRSRRPSTTRARSGAASSQGRSSS
jgi:ferritin-like metal-binding protein YciE